MAYAVDQLKATIAQGGGLARANQFLVNLPSLGRYDTSTINLLCASVNLPGRQILTMERLVGVKGRKLPNGFASDDVSLTFYVLNNYEAVRYFHDWQALAVGQASYEISYPAAYQRDVTIAQLKRPIRFDVPFDLFGREYNLQVGSRASLVYRVRLQDAFCTTVNAIEYNSDPDGLVQITAELSYTNWDLV